jgi:hypothetical protein
VVSPTPKLAERLPAASLAGSSHAAAHTSADRSNLSNSHNAGSSATDSSDAVTKLPAVQSAAASGAAASADPATSSDSSPESNQSHAAEQSATLAAAPKTPPSVHASSISNPGASAQSMPAPLAAPAGLSESNATAEHSANHADAKNGAAAAQQNGDSKATKKSSQSGAGSESQVSTSGTGKGRSGGQNPPKKSRGVAPLLLGVTQQDVLQGPVSSGPDEVKVRSMKPQPGPQSPASAAMTATRTCPELQVTPYVVEGESRDLVNNYFAQLHSAPADNSPENP